MEDPDGDLVRRAGEGDEAAADALVRRKLPRMLALARRLLNNATEAEDVVQDLFLRTWQQAPRWRPGHAKFDTWMHRVTLNLCTDRLRRRREQPLPDAWDAPDPAASADQVLEEVETGGRVEQALASLAPRQREALVLTYYQELPNKEAAALMEIGVDALESLLSRGRRALKAKLAEEL